MVEPEPTPVAEEESVVKKPDGVHIAMVPPFRLAVKATAGARVVGKSGASIKAIRAESGATVRVFQDELPDVLKRRDENIVLASCGEVSSLKVAVLSILDRIFDRSGLPDAAERGRERPYVVDVLVPQAAAGPLVGPGGERVKALIQELNCDIDVVREPLAGIAEQRRVRVLSRERALVEAGVWRLQEILAELVESGTLKPEHFELREAVVTENETQRLQRSDGEVPLRVLLAPGEAAVVVGKMGYSIRRLRDIATVSVDGTDAPAYQAELPRFDPNESVFSAIRASLTDRLRVLRLIVADLVTSRSTRRSEPLPEDSLPEGSRPCSIRLLLPSDRWDVLARTLPDANQSICSLQADTGAESTILESEPSASFKRVQLQGSEDQVAAAVWRLHQMLEPWEPYEVPPRYIPAARSAADDGDEGKGQGKGGKSKSTSIPRPSVAEGRPETRLLATAANIPRANAEINSGMRGASQTEFLQQSSHEATSMSIPRTPATSSVTTSSAHLPPDAASKTVFPNAHSANITNTSTFGDVPRAEPVKHLENYDQHIGCPMLVRVQSDAVATLLAERSGIAQRAGVKLRAWLSNPADCRPPSLEIVGSAECCAVACYLIQVYSWLCMLDGCAS